MLYENTKLFMRQIGILISSFFNVPIFPTFCGQCMVKAKAADSGCLHVNVEEKW